MLCKVVLTFKSVDETLKYMTIQIKATEQFFPVVLLIILYVVPTFIFIDETKGFNNEHLYLLKVAFLRPNAHKHVLNNNLVFVFSCRKLKEDKEEIEEQRRLRQEEEERSLVTVSFFKTMCSEQK